MLERSLHSFAIPFWGVVLRERFLLPLELLAKEGIEEPKTIADLVALSGMPEKEVLAIVLECEELSKGIGFVKKADVAFETLPEGVFICDVSPLTEECLEPIIPHAKQFHYANKVALLELMKAYKKVYFVADQIEIAWSAAMAAAKRNISAAVVSY